ncbi:MAG: hypothetical protein WKF59_06295 [Chitinophagaceae bacterium]
MAQIPLAERLRPTTLNDLVGQEHLTGEGSILRTAIEPGKNSINDPLGTTGCW